jgi:hypothetical protein
VLPVGGRSELSLSLASVGEDDLALGWVPVEEVVAASLSQPSHLPVILV